MNIDWKALKKSKEQELPEAERKRKEYIEYLVKLYEKRLYIACKSQEAGTEEYYDPRYLSDHEDSLLSTLKNTFELMFCVDIIVPLELHQKVMRIVRDNLVQQGINCRFLDTREDYLLIKLP